MGFRPCKRRVYFVTGLFVAAMHCSHPASGALPARFRRQRILIVGCGDIGARLLRRMQTSRQRLHVIVLCRNASNAKSIRQFGVRVLWGDLDRAHSLARFAGLAHRVVHLAPQTMPASSGGEICVRWHWCALCDAAWRQGNWYMAAPAAYMATGTDPG